MSNRGNPSPDPIDPIRGLIGAFDAVPIVALGEVHGLQQETDLIVSLLETPGFTDRVNAIVVEFGNALYQPTIDRFISGEAVRREELVPVWRDVVGGMRGRVFESPIYERFFAAARERNQRLPPDRRIRVLLGDPPFDRRDSGDEARLWEAIDRRDDHFAGVVEDEVLARGQRALLIAGTGHFTRIGDLPPPRRTVVQILEDRYPGSTRVILPHFIFEDVYARRRAEADALEARLGPWPVPSMASIAGTWLDGIDAGLLFGHQARWIEPDGSVKVVEAPFRDRRGQALSRVTLGQVVDDFLYLGPVRDLTSTDTPT